MKRETFFEPELYKRRISQDRCPVCGYAKFAWKRRTDWTCCSVECTAQYGKNVFTWPEFRMKILQRDNFTCLKCKVVPVKYILDNGKYFLSVNEGDLHADHIVPIAMGGLSWDKNNLQTLCKGCHRSKTGKDVGLIWKWKKNKKVLQVNQTL